MALLAQFGVPEYWIVDPAKNLLEIYALANSAHVLVGTWDEAGRVTSPTLPGLSFEASRIFAE
jgi:Uma2 family endonuclease